MSFWGWVSYVNVGEHPIDVSEKSVGKVLLDAGAIDKMRQSLAEEAISERG